MTPVEISTLTQTLRDRYSVTPHEVILVGERKNKTVELPAFEGTTEAEKKEYLLKHFKFTRTSVPKEDALKVGQKSNKFFHLLVAQPSGEKIILANGTTVKRSSRTNKYGWHTLFEREGITFDEIKTEVASGEFTIVGDLSDGKIRLTGYVLMGAWIEGDVGFRFKIHSQDATGKMTALESYKRDENGKLVKGVAEDRLIRFFVLENQYDILESLVANRVEQAEKYKIASPTTHSDQTAPEVVIDQSTETAKEEADI